MKRTIEHNFGQYKNGKLIKVFIGTKALKHNGYNISKVFKCANGRLEEHKGFEWKLMKNVHGLYFEK